MNVLHYERLKGTNGVRGINKEEAILKLFGMLTFLDSPMEKQALDSLAYLCVEYSHWWRG